MTQEKIRCSLQIRGLELSVELGWPDKERQQQQVVFLDLDIHFAEIPQACLSDKLEDTFCYSHLTGLIRSSLAQREFHLIEYLSHEIYHIVKKKMPANARISVKITKHPSIEGLSDGVSFNYYDGCD